MRRVRSEINLPNMPAGTEHDVDDSDPWIAGLIGGGLLSLLDIPPRVACWCCEPPTFWDTDAGFELHVEVAHQGRVCDGRGDGER